MLKKTIGNLITIAGLPSALPTDHGLPLVDFVIEAPEGLRAVEIADGSRIGRGQLQRIFRFLTAMDSRIAGFQLLSRQPPGDGEVAAFGDLANGYLPAQLGRHLTCRWDGAAGFLDSVGLAGALDPLDDATQDRCAKAATALRLRACDAAPGESLPERIARAEAAFPRLPLRLLSLTRQLEPSVIAGLLHGEEVDTTALHIGETVGQTVLLMSDLKNFSTMARLVREEVLHEIMAEYYEKSRDIVWHRGGALINFVGDAVVAAFGYPNEDLQAPLQALQVGADLIELGERLFNGILQAEMNEEVTIGTRVGLSSGPSTVLDLGQGALELTLVGNTINLAARLEGNARPDGLLLDNRTLNVLRDVAPGALDDSQLERLRLEPDMAKGQLHPLIAWHLGLDAIQR